MKNLTSISFLVILVSIAVCGRIFARDVLLLSLLLLLVVIVATMISLKLLRKASAESSSMRFVKIFVLTAVVFFNSILCFLALFYEPNLDMPQKLIGFLYSSLLSTSILLIIEISISKSMRLPK
jgi:hypothetical protein